MDLFRASFGHSVAGLFISPLSDQWTIIMLIPFPTHPAPLMRSSPSFRTLASNSAPSPGLRSRPSKALAHTTAARVETVVLTLTARPPVPDGSRPVISGTASRGSYRVGSSDTEGAIGPEAMLPGLTAGTACRCAGCEWRRATQMTQALRNKFGNGLAPLGGEVDE